MFARRNLRRNLVLAVCLPMVLLGLFVIHRNRDSTSADPGDFAQQEYPSQLVRDINQIGSIRLKRSTSQSMLSDMSRPQSNLQPNLSAMSIGNLNSNYRVIQSMKSLEEPLYPVFNATNLERFVHLDLKGAAPMVSYYETLFPFLKQLGATGLLIEYEDMFPYTGRLQVIQHGLAYKKDDVQRILQLAEINHLKVMPLLQVYGHLEYVLKLKEFMHLREDSRYPQVITPCLEESYKLIFDMIDQMLLLHPSIPYLHLGCDEVYYRLIHPQCSQLNFRDDADLFIKHVTRIAKYVKLKRPGIKLFIWHDMISQLVNSGSNDIRELTELVVPMIWTYVDDVKTWFDRYFWMRFSTFREVWVASSFKGSSGEVTTMSYIGHHQRNQQTWLETMHTAASTYQINFTGVAITGWSRYDHMLSLCELLPSSIPSLAYSLQTILHGRIDFIRNQTIAKVLLGCNQIPLWERPPYYMYLTCTFPGHELYEMMHQYDSLLRQYDETMSFVRLFLTDIHLRQNYIHYKRSEECLQRLYILEEQMVYFINSFQQVCVNFFTADIAPEWLQTYLMRKYKEVQQRINFLHRTLKAQSFWPKRPLPNNTAAIVVKRRNFTLNTYV